MLSMPVLCLFLKIKDKKILIYLFTSKDDNPESIDPFGNSRAAGY